MSKKPTKFTESTPADRKHPLSAHDLLKDLIGVIADGPTDLSTNPKHFEDFGLERSRWRNPS